MGEGQDRAGRVLPHPGQGQEGVQVVGQDAAVLLDDAAGALDETQGPARVAQAPPNPQHRSGGGLGELGGAGPAPHPLLPGGDDAGHRGLLAHDLRDEDLPRRGTGPAPRQVAGMGVVPGHDVLRRGRSGKGVVRGGAVGHGGHRSGNGLGEAGCLRHQPAESRRTPRDRRVGTRFVPLPYEAEA